MAESEPKVERSTVSDEHVKAPNLLERAKEEIEAIFHSERSPINNKETHGLRSDIDESTPTDGVRAPNLLERAKEEIEALVQTIYHRENSGRDETSTTGLNSGTPSSLLGKDAKVEKSSHHHHKETHGMNDDIDENTPISNVKGPNVFERAKEEIEALVQTIHPKKGSSKHVSSPKEGGLPLCLGRGLEKICSPWTR